MKTTMEQKITVAKIPYDSFQYFCMKCQTSLDAEWECCPKCGVELNAGLQ